MQRTGSLPNHNRPCRSVKRRTLPGLAPILGDHAFSCAAGGTFPLLVRGVLAFLVCCLLGVSVAACGGGQRQDAKEPAGTYDVQVVTASFPEDQSISQNAPM